MQTKGSAECCVEVTWPNMNLKPNKLVFELHEFLVIIPFWISEITVICWINKSEFAQLQVKWSGLKYLVLCTELNTEKQ